MNKADFNQIIKKLKSVYTLRTFLADAQSYEVWYEAFKDIDTNRLSAAINKYISLKNVPPTPADIKELLEHPDQKEPSYKRMIWWGLYDPEGNEVNDVYANPSMSNQDVKAWFGRGDDVDGYTVRRKYERNNVH